MSVLDRTIDLERARAAGACIEGRRWAQDHPGATIRELAAVSTKWAGWYLTQVEGLADWPAALALMELVNVTTDAEKVAAVIRMCDGRHAVRALSGWWNDDARVVRALAGAGWGLEPMARAMRHAWYDMDRVVRALAVLAPSDVDLAYAAVVTSSISTPQVIRTLGALWGDENRVYRALTPYGDRDDRKRRAVETAWDGLDRPDNLQPLSIPAPAQA
jgi:hypothetical protein